MDTAGTQLAVLYREVSLIQTLICAQVYVVGTVDSVLNREVSLIHSVLYREVPVCLSMLIKHNPILKHYRCVTVGGVLQWAVCYSGQCVTVGGVLQWVEHVRLQLVVGVYTIFISWTLQAHGMSTPLH